MVADKIYYYISKDILVNPHVNLKGVVAIISDYFEIFHAQF